MFEKVTKFHVDKLCDRIGGALVDLAYQKQENPKVAIEVMLGHNRCYIINETDTHLSKKEVKKIVYRIVGEKVKVNYLEVKQDKILAQNQVGELKCGDNGIFKGVPVNKEQERLCRIVYKIEENYPYDGKYIMDESNLIICQSHVTKKELETYYPNAQINPLGDWTGGQNVDTGAINRKLGSDMGKAITGGGLHGKDLSKADVSVNIYAHLKAQETKEPVYLYCAIGDKYVDGKPYAEIVEIARAYIKNIGGFEKLAEHGLIWWRK